LAGWYNAGAEAGGRVIRILVVDDIDLLRRGAVSLVRGQPEWQVVGEAVDGLEAVAKAEQLRPDIIT
jgi:chemotaxis response regulator CheB